MKNNVKMRTALVAAFIYAVLGVSGCESGLSGTDSIPLASPTALQITPGNEELVVRWTKVAPAKGVPPRYELYWSTSENPGNVFKEVPTNAASQLITGTITELENGTRYYVWVKSVFDGIGKSDFSPRSSGIPVPVPGNVEAITVYPGYQMLELGWDTVPAASGYEVYYSTSGTSDDLEPPDGADMRTVSADPGSVQGAVLHGLSNGTNYTIWVRAANSAGKSPGYSTITGTPSPGPVPSAPESIEARGGDKKVIVTWDQVPGVKEYNLHYGTTDDFSSPLTIPGPTVLSTAPKNTDEITGLSNGITYYVWVISSNGQGNESCPSSCASALTAELPPIEFNNIDFELGDSTADFPFAQDLPVNFLSLGGGAGSSIGGQNWDRLTRVQETALGDLFADGAAWYLKVKLGKYVDFVFINGEYIDNTFSQNTITVGSLMSIVPTGRRNDKLVIVKMKGSELKKFFYDSTREASLTAWNAGGDVAGAMHTGRGSSGTGNFGVVSREARYTLEYPQAPSEGPLLNSTASEPYYHGRIKPGTLKINGADIVDGNDYYIGTTDYLAVGAYFTTLSIGRISIENINVEFWKGVAEYIYGQGTISPYTDGRIKIEGGVNLPPPWVNSNWKPAWLD